MTTNNGTLPPSPESPQPDGKDHVWNHAIHALGCLEAFLSNFKPSSNDTKVGAQMLDEARESLAFALLLYRSLKSKD